METKPKVGIFAMPFSNNYGAIVLTYALQKVLSGLGKDPVVLNYDYYALSRKLTNVKEWTEDSRYSKKYVVARVYSKIVRTIGSFSINNLWQTKRSKKFKETNLKITKRVHTIPELERELESYNAVVVGGDQLWNVSGLEYARVHFLNIDLPDSVRKVSYGPCFGRKDVSAALETVIGDSLRDFDSLAVRNTISQEVVKRLSGCDAKVVVDPTFLTSYDEVTADTDLGKGQIVFYFIRTSQSDMSSMKRNLREQLRQDILSVSFNPRFLGADKWAWGAGPSEWLAIFKNAEYVVTDSFHGTIFALKNRKPFIAFAKDPQGVRMADMLQRYGLEERLVFSPEQVTADLMLKSIDYERVSKDIERDVRESHEYLKNALS